MFFQRVILNSFGACAKFMRGVTEFPICIPASGRGCMLRAPGVPIASSYTTMIPCRPSTSAPRSTAINRDNSSFIRSCLASRVSFRLARADDTSVPVLPAGPVVFSSYAIPTLASVQHATRPPERRSIHQAHHHCATLSELIHPDFAFPMSNTRTMISSSNENFIWQKYIMKNKQIRIQKHK